MNRIILSYYDNLTSYRKKVYVSLFNNKGSVLLGWTCSEGALTLEVAKKVKATEILGIDLDPESIFITR